MKENNEHVDFFSCRERSVILKFPLLKSEYLSKGKLPNQCDFSEEKSTLLKLMYPFIFFQLLLHCKSNSLLKNKLYSSVFQVSSSTLLFKRVWNDWILHRKELHYTSQRKCIHRLCQKIPIPTKAANFS